MTSMSSHHQDKATFLERLIFNNRPAVIVICLLVSMFLFWQATLIRPSTSFEKMIPLKHPFIEKMLEHRNDLANLGNTVRISVEATDGDIFSKEYMETLRQINDEVFYISGVDRSGLKSLWSPSVRWTEVTEEGFAGGEVIPQSYNGSADSLDLLRNNVLKSGQVGRLVANDFKSSIVDIPLLESYPDPQDQGKLLALDYQKFSHELEDKIRNKFEKQNPNVQIHIVGFAKKVGDLIDVLSMRTSRGTETLFQKPGLGGAVAADMGLPAERFGLWEMRGANMGNYQLGDREASNLFVASKEVQDNALKDLGPSFVVALQQRVDKTPLRPENKFNLGRAPMNDYDTELKQDYLKAIGKARVYYRAPVERWTTRGQIVSHANLMLPYWNARLEGLNYPEKALFFVIN